MVPLIAEHQPRGDLGVARVREPLAPMSATGRSPKNRAMPLAGRDAQSIASFRNPGIPHLYSGVAISSPSAARSESLSSTTPGRWPPRSRASWLNRGSEPITVSGPRSISVSAGPVLRLHRAAPGSGSFAEASAEGEYSHRSALSCIALGVCPDGSQRSGTQAPGRTSTVAYRHRQYVCISGRVEATTRRPRETTLAAGRRRTQRRSGATRCVPGAMRCHAHARRNVSSSVAVRRDTPLPWQQLRPGSRLGSDGEGVNVVGKDPQRSRPSFRARPSASTASRSRVRGD